MLRLINGNNFDIKDIAHSLSMICRWGGHTKTWHSVAEHSVRVCDELSGKDRCYGLLHDAAEYIWGDLCSPLKEFVPDYVWEVEKLQRKIYRHFGLDPTVPKTLRPADLKIREWEYKYYVTVKRYDSWAPESARRRFLDTFLANNAIIN